MNVAANIRGLNCATKLEEPVISGKSGAKMGRVGVRRGARLAIRTQAMKVYVKEVLRWSVEKSSFLILLLFSELRCGLPYMS